MSEETFEFLSAEEANKIVPSYDNNLNDEYVRAYLKETIEYGIKEAAKEGKKSVEIKEDANLKETTEKFIIHYLKSKGYDASLITKTNCWKDEWYDYKVFSIKWGEEN